MEVEVCLKNINQVVINRKVDTKLDYDSELHKTNCDINNEFAHGICNILHTSGFILIQNQYHIKKKLKESYSVNGDYIQMSLAINGESHIVNENFNLKIQERYIQLAYIPNIKLELELHPTYDYKYIRIFIAKQYFIDLLKNEGWTNDDILYQNVLKGNYINFGYLKYNLNYSILNIINQIIQSDFDKAYTQYYLQNKLRELFFLHHIESIADNKESSNTEIEALKEAKSFLELNYKNPPTIQELSKKIFLNEFKLKKGFKEQFNTTIHKFVMNKRMEKALELLQEDKQINEIAIELGYKSTSHFITNFKNYMGYTPSKIVKK